MGRSRAILCAGCNNLYYAYCLGLQNTTLLWFYGTRCQASMTEVGNRPRHTSRPMSGTNSSAQPVNNASPSTSKRKQRVALKGRKIGRQGRRASATPRFQGRRRNKIGHRRQNTKQQKPGYQKRLKERVRASCKELDLDRLRRKAKKRRIPLWHRSRTQLATRIIQLDEGADKPQEGTVVRTAV